MTGIIVARILGSHLVEFLPRPGAVCVRVANSPCFASCFCQMTVVLENILLQMYALSWWQHLWVFLRQHPSRFKTVGGSGGRDFLKIKFEYLILEPRNGARRAALGTSFVACPCQHTRLQTPSQTVPSDF